MQTKQSSSINCEHCGSVSLRGFQSCENRQSGYCPYAFYRKTPCSGKVPGFLMLGMGGMLLLGMGSLPFAIFSQGPPAKEPPSLQQ
jgi:hypothetical protein